jgi:organic hydroperoxide reductase OsmC/OhrA
MKLHHYNTTTTWTGNQGSGTSEYKAYERSHLIQVEGKPSIEGSSDAAFRGDKTKYTPEDMLVASISTCHMLWYLHLCSVNGVIVTSYTDQATGVMEEDSQGSGIFTEVTLHPVVIIREEAMKEKANALHHDANKMCFIANSLKFPVYHKPKANVKESAGEVNV